VQRARGESAEARQALGELCEAYWNPVFRFLRGQGRDEESARELTQEFFARLLAGRGLQGAEPGRGRFRSYLLGALKHFLADWRDHTQRLKRGGGVELAPLEVPGGTDTAPALQVPDPAAMPDDRVFDQAWALAVMERALRALQEEYARQDKSHHFELLKPWLQGETPGLSQAETAACLGMNESALKVAIHRLRKRFREAVRAELAQTVATEAEVDVELRYLVEVLAQGPRQA